jgi:hypothetical protein
LWGRPPDSQPAQQELNLREYISALDRSSAVLSESDPAVIHKFRVALPSEWVVQAAGQNNRVKTDWLAEALTIIEKNPQAKDSLVQESKRRLTLLHEAAEELARPTPREQELEGSRGQLDHILSAREFQGAHGPSWFDIQKARVYAWIFDQLEKIFGRVGHSSAIGNTIVWVLIFLAVLLLAYWAVSAIIQAGPQSKIDLRGASAGGRTWRDWLREARAAAERGDHRAAVHAAYWAGVARLEEARLLPEDRSRTPRESLRLVKRDNAAYAPLAQLTHCFELIWYGNRAATSSDWADAIQQLEALGCLGSSIPAIAGS